MSTESSCPTRLISDIPSEFDEFGSAEQPGPHELVAHAIAEVITSEPGGKTIGLEGGWGSGKSTIVNLLKRDLEGSGAAKVLVFDTWAHEGDPLRRAFLETLVQTMLDWKWLCGSKKDKWRLNLNDLRTQHSLATEKPEKEPIVVLLVLLAVGILLLPLAAELISHGWEIGFATDPRVSAGPNWAVIFGWLLFALPVVALGLSLRKTDALIWLIHNVLPPRMTVTIDRPEPTSVEFQRCFRQLAEDALAGDNRLVLVLDNLDRVDPDDALAIMSTLQTFLDPLEQQRIKHIHNIWVVVPYDRVGLERLWAQERGEGHSGDESAHRPPRCGVVASSMLDKRFQLRFTVPPLALSDWRAYLFKLLKEAFPQHSESEFHSAYRVYSRARTDGPPTPRELKILVNQVGAIHRQWGDLYPLHHMLYYVVLRRQGRRILEELCTRTIPEQTLSGLLGNTIEDHLAAICLNVPVHTARQITIEEPIVEALRAADVPRLKQLSQNRGFWEVLEVLNFRQATKDPVDLASAGYCLHESRLLSKAAPLVSSAIAASLGDACTEMRSLSPFNQETAKGIGAILEITRQRKLAVHVLSVISSGVIDDEQPEYEDTVCAWVDGLTTLLGVLPSLDMEDVLTSEAILVPSGPSGYIYACARLCSVDTQGKYWGHMGTAVDPDKIARALITMVSSGSFGDTGVRAIRVLKAGQLSVPWEELIGGMSVAVENESRDGVELLALMQALWELRDTHPSSRESVVGLAQQGILLSSLVGAVRQEEWNVAAWLLFSHLEVAPPVHPPAKPPACVGGVLVRP